MTEVQNTPKITAKQQAIRDMREEFVDTAYLSRSKELREFIQSGRQY